MGMNVLYYAPGWPPGAYPNGIVTYVDHIRRGLSGRGVDSMVLASEVAQGVRDERVFDLRNRGPLRSVRGKLYRVLYRVAPDRAFYLDLGRSIARAVRRIHRQNRLDVFEMEESFGVAGLIARSIPCRTVVRLHGPWFLNGLALGVEWDEAFELRHQREGKAIARAGALSSPSQDVLDRVRSKFGLELPHAEVIPNPAPDVPVEKRWEVAKAEEDRILFVGRFDRHKGGDLVIDAFRQVGLANPKAKLTFIGPDRGLKTKEGRTFDLGAYLEDRIPENAIRARVEVLGAQPREVVETWRRRASVTVIPSRFEVFAMTVLEALAFGSPIVAADVGGIPEMVRKEKNGLLFESENAADLSTKILSLLGSRELQVSLGTQAQRDAVERFGVSVVGARMHDFYQRVLDGRACRRGVRSLSVTAVRG
jgi:glycosyltransferase involved in cell wall biosynthesis